MITSRTFVFGSHGVCSQYATPEYDVRMVPSKLDSSPSKHFNRVDFPEPTGPSRRANAPRRIFHYSISMTATVLSGYLALPLTEPQKLTEEVYLMFRCLP